MTKVNDILLLHGWGKDKNSYSELLKEIKAPQIGRIVAIDLPGFGDEPLAKTLTLDDYVKFVLAYITKNKLKNIILIGHSFGGRVALKIVANNNLNVEKLILIDSGGIREVTFKMRIASVLPRFGSFGRSLFGSKDYLNASGELRETLKNVVNEDLEPLLESIKVPTLIVWGENDHTTPLWMGEVMHKKIAGSKFSVIPKGDHGIPYRRAIEVAKVIKEFI